MARILIGNIKGPQGAQGIQGPQGSIGPQGPQGPLPPLINNALATTPGVAALDAVMGKTLNDAKVDKGSFRLARSRVDKTVPNNTPTLICSYTATADIVVSAPGWITTAGNSTGVRQVRVDVAGYTAYFGGTPAGQNLVGFSVVAQLRAGEKIEIHVTQTSGIDLTATAYVNSNVTFI